MEYFDVPSLVGEKALMRLLFVVNVDWFFISHRLPIAIAAISRGIDVHLVCADTGRISEIRKHGIKVHPLKLARSGTNFFSESLTVFDLYKLCKNIEPDILHAVTIKPVIYTSIIAKVLRIKSRVFSISGLGYVFVGTSLKSKLIRSVVSILYRTGLRNRNSIVIFQNDSDLSLFKKLGIVDQEQCRIIKGSGVDLAKYPFSPLPSGKPIVMFLARLLKDKGVVEFCEAARIFRNSEESDKADFVLVGDLDVQNPSSLDPSTLNEYISSGDVLHWGFTNNAADTISKSTLMVLPSYREGLPKSLIEAAAIGRPVVTTNVPGCRDSIIPNKTGVLVPVKQVTPLVSAISCLLKDRDMCSEMGRQGRALAVEVFDINSVIEQHFEIYEELL